MKIGKKMRWSDDDVVMWAEIFVTGKETTLMEMEEVLEVSHSTIWWCFTHRLIYIDSEMYDKVMGRMKVNTHKRRRRKIGDGKH